MREHCPELLSTSLASKPELHLMTTGTQSCQNTEYTLHTRPEEWRDTWASLSPLLGVLLPQAPQPLLALHCRPRSQQPPADLTASASHRCGVSPSHPSLAMAPIPCCSCLLLLPPTLPRLRYSFLHAHTVSHFLPPFFCL